MVGLEYPSQTHPPLSFNVAPSFFLDLHPQIWGPQDLFFLLYLQFDGPS